MTTNCTYLTCHPSSTVPYVHAMLKRHVNHDCLAICSLMELIANLVYLLVLTMEHLNYLTNFLIHGTTTKPPGSASFMEDMIMG